MKAAAQQVPNGPLQELSYYEELCHDLQVDDASFGSASYEAQVGAYRQLAVQAFAAAEVQAQALSAESRRAWHVARVECHCPRPFPLSDAARVKVVADREASQRSGVSSDVHRVRLLVQVHLACSIAPSP